MEKNESNRGMSSLSVSVGVRPGGVENQPTIFRPVLVVVVIIFHLFAGLPPFGRFCQFVLGQILTQSVTAADDRTRAAAAIVGRGLWGHQRGPTAAVRSGPTTTPFDLPMRALLVAAIPAQLTKLAAPQVKVLKFLRVFVVGAKNVFAIGKAHLLGGLIGRGTGDAIFGPSLATLLVSQKRVN